jgi:hypothetical protein
MENHSESVNENSVTAWSYQHDWSSDSCSSDEDSSRSSTAEPAHSLHRPEKPSKVWNMPKSVVLQEGVRSTTSSSEAPSTESGACVESQVAKVISDPVDNAIKTDSMDEQSRVASTAKLDFHKNPPSPPSPPRSIAALEEKMHTENERAQTPVVRVNDTSAAESLHSPRPQRYFRPSVTRSEDPAPSLPLYDDIRAYTGLPHFPTSQYNYPISNEGQPPYTYPEAVNPSIQEHPLDTLNRLPGFESLSKTLSQQSSELDPIYRGFEEIRHRIALHLQHEISQLEDALHKLDREIQTTNASQTTNSTSPSSTIGPDGHLRGYMRHDVLLLKHKRTLLLGRIFEKIQQYGKYLIKE